VSSPLRGESLSSKKLQRKHSKSAEAGLGLLETRSVLADVLDRIDIVVCAATVCAA